MEDENSDDDEAFEAFQRELDELQRETIDERHELACPLPDSASVAVSGREKPESTSRTTRRLCGSRRRRP
jgi:hypothetical protein